MSIFADSTSMLAGCLVASAYPGLGAPGATILAASSAGDSGAGPLAGLSLAATTDYYWIVTSAPSSGSLTIYEDGSFSHTGAADGTWVWSASVYAAGILQWTLTISDVIGEGATTYTEPRRALRLGAAVPRAAELVFEHGGDARIGGAILGPTNWS